MSRFNFWPNCKSGGLIEQDAELTVVSFEDIPLDEFDSPDVPDVSPTSLAVCRWCDGPASPALDDCCARCSEKLKRRAATREPASQNSSRIDFY